MPRHLHLEVSLLGVADPPRRQFLLRDDATFADLHEAIQVACGWRNIHLWCFRDHREVIAAPADDNDPLGPEAAAVPVTDHLEPGTTIVYEYDFGDGWEHAVHVLGHGDAEETVQRHLLSGELAFPPEDAGGIPGYEDALAIARGEVPDGLTDDPEELQSRREWLGDWDPDGFDFEATRRAFDR